MLKKNMKKSFYYSLIVLMLITGCHKNSSSSSSISTLPSSSSPPPSSISSMPSLPEAHEVTLGNGLSYETSLYRYTPEEEAPLEIYFLEMMRQYGDSIFLKKGNLDILIDTGDKEDVNNLKAFLNEKVTDKRLDLVISTHPHSDHNAGFKNGALSEILDVSMIIDYGYPRNGDSNYNGYQNWRNNMINKGAYYHSAKASVEERGDSQKTYYLSDYFTVDILDTGFYYDSRPSSNVDINSTSVAAIFNYHDFKFFTAGDLTAEAERELLIRNPYIPEVTLYKASHHGSSGSNVTELLKKINPKTIAISAGREGDIYGNEGHPHSTFISQSYKLSNIKDNLNIYWNMVNGTMNFITHGEDNASLFLGSPTKLGYYYPSGYNPDKVIGEENYKLHESQVFKTRNYQRYLPRV